MADGPSNSRGSISFVLRRAFSSFAQPQRGASGWSLAAIPRSRTGTTTADPADIPDPVPTWAETCTSSTHALQEGIVCALAWRPILSVCALQIVLLVFLVSLCHDLTVDLSVEWLYGGTNASLYQSCYRHAWLDSDLAPRSQLRQNAFGLLDSVPDSDLFSFAGNASVGEESTYTHISLHLVFSLSEGDLLTEQNLYAIRLFEEDLRLRPAWRELCGRSGGGGGGNASSRPWSCDPGESFVNFAWPRVNGSDGLSPQAGQRRDLLLDGGGGQWLPTAYVIQALAAGGEPLERLPRFLPSDHAVGGGAGALRSHFLFSLPLGEEEAREAFDGMLNEALFPALGDSPMLEERGIRASAYGQALHRHEVALAWRGDVGLCLGGLFLSLLVLLVRARSLLLALLCAPLLVEALFLGVSLFRLVTGAAQLSLPCSAAFFLLSSLGADVAVLPVLDGWRLVVPLQRKVEGLPSDDASAEVWLLKKRRSNFRRAWSALLPCFPAAATCSAGSCLACLASGLATFREVGLLLGLSVLSAAVLLPCMLILVLVALEDRQLRQELAEYGGMAAGVPDGSLWLPPRIERFLDELWQLWVSSLSALRWWLLASMALLLVVTFVGTVAAADSSAAFDDLFSPGHPRLAPRRLLDRFDGSLMGLAASPSSQSTQICDLAVAPQGSEWELCRDGDTRCGAWASMGRCLDAPAVQERCPRSCGTCSVCSLHHCEVPQPTSAGHLNETCECRREPGLGTRVIGLPIEAWPELRGNLSDILQVSFEEGGPWKQPPLVLEHWRSGSSRVLPSFASPPVRGADFGVSCFCGGGPACTGSGEPIASFAFPVETTVGSRASGKGSVGNPHGMELRHRGREVGISWGIVVREPPFFPRGPLSDSWGLDPMFDPGDPWAQRSLVAMCSDLPRALRADSEPTWLHAFEAWLLRRGGQFPSRSFHADVRTFLEEQPLHRRNVIIQGGEVRALRVLLNVKLADPSSVDEAAQLKAAWDAHVGERSRASGLRARGAWHASELWELPELRRAAADAACLGILITFALVAFAAGCAARDATLVLLLLGTWSSLLLAEAFVLLALCQWSLGPMGALALVLLAGHGALPLMRIVCAYGHAPGRTASDPATESVGFFYGMREHHATSAAAGDRFHRTLYALEMTGWTALASAAIAACTALFLLLCTLQFNVKFGVALCVATVLSLLHAFVFLPTLLLLIGPSPHGWQPLAACVRRIRAAFPPQALETAEAPKAEVGATEIGESSGSLGCDALGGSAGRGGHCQTKKEAPGGWPQEGHTAATGDVLFLKSGGYQRKARTPETVDVDL